MPWKTHFRNGKIWIALFESLTAVVAQLAERLFLTPEVRCFIAIIYMFFKLYLIDENKGNKRPGMVQYKKQISCIFQALK